ncbi:ribosomal protein L18e/L15P [Usnea florida]
MPSKFLNLLRVSPPISRPGPEISTFLVPFLYAQKRDAHILMKLADNPSALHKKIRRGRGPSSGKGKTSGRGHKGQKQHGKVPRGFNGGQTKDEVVHGKRGDHKFSNFSVDMQPLNLSKLQDWVNQGRLDPSKPITIKELRQSRCVTNIKDGVKLLAKGSEELKAPLNVIISRASAKAIAAVEAAGGSVITRYYTAFAVRRISQGKMDPIHSLQSRIKVGEEAPRKSFYNRLPDPTSRKDIEYYRDPAHRGYLSYLVPKGHGPSLFFKTPGTSNSAAKKKSKSGATAADNTMW